MAFSTRSLGLVAGTIVAFAGAAQADELLLIDLTVPNQITISSTTGLSAATVSGGNTTGFYLQNFYAGPGSGPGATVVAGANLTAFGTTSDGTPSLFRGGLAGGDPGLNVWSFATTSTINFTSGQQAFTGSATWNLTAAGYTAMLGGSTTGNIYFPADTVDDLTSAQVLGTYRVIPTPAAATLMGLGLGLGALRRRR